MAWIQQRAILLKEEALRSATCRAEQIESKTLINTCFFEVSQTSHNFGRLEASTSSRTAIFNRLGFVCFDFQYFFPPTIVLTKNLHLQHRLRPVDQRIPTRNKEKEFAANSIVMAKYAYAPLSIVSMNAYVCMTSN